MLLRRVEHHLKQYGIPAARFGREAVNDPAFVFDLRDGRRPRGPMVARVEAYIALVERTHGEQDARPC